MIQVIPFESLGHQKHGWLDARHHFSFARYFDPNRSGYPPLRVWNDDTIKAGTGFPLHPHQDMEIITYVRSGAITHQDNLGNQGRIAAGDIQVMSAGSGIMHSEYNHEEVDTTLFQIWIETARRNVEPRWETRPFPKQNTGKFELLASGRPEHAGSGALEIYQDAALWVARAVTASRLHLRLGPERRAYLVPAVGSIVINGVTANARDGVYITNVEDLQIEMLSDGEMVLVDLPPI
ncbi:MAG: pirin family protein [Candidatus Neomarinimicrobiota bacterium]